MGKAAANDLGHGLIIVLVGKALHLKPLVFTFLGLSIHKDHHTGHDIRSGYIGNIVGLDPSGGLYCQHFSKLGENRGNTFLPACDSLGLLKGIFTGQFNQADIISPLRHMKLWQAAIFLFQQLRKQFRVVNGERQ